MVGSVDPARTALRGPRVRARWLRMRSPSPVRLAGLPRDRPFVRCPVSIAPARFLCSGSGYPGSPSSPCRRRCHTCPRVDASSGQIHVGPMGANVVCPEGKPRPKARTPILIAKTGADRPPRLARDVPAPASGEMPPSRGIPPQGNCHNGRTTRGPYRDPFVCALTDVRIAEHDDGAGAGEGRAWSAGWARACGGCGRGPRR